MDELRAEFDNCAAALEQINAQRASLHAEMARRFEAEAIEPTARVEAQSRAVEWRPAVENLVAECIAQYKAAHSRLLRQNERVEHTLRKMDVARSAMSWRVREIDALLDDLSRDGLRVTAEDMSLHLWSKMLEKLGNSTIREAGTTAK